MSKPVIHTANRLDKGPLVEWAQIFTERHHFWILSFILLLALALRLIALLDFKYSLYYDFMLWDERLYHEWAERIADGTFYSSSVFEFAPVPAYFIALIYKIFSPNIVYIRYANIIFGVFTCYLVYLIGKELSNRNVGLAAALIACLYKPYILYSIVPLKTSLSVFLFAAAVYFFMAVFNRPSLPKAMFLGFFMGLVNYVRPNAIVLVPLFPLLILWNHWKVRTSWKAMAAMLLLYAGGLTLVHSPFMLRNYQVAGESGPSTSQSGIHLYMSNYLGDKRWIQFVTTSPAERGIHFTIEASRRLGRRLTQRESSDYWTREFFRSALEKPDRFAAKLFKKCCKECHFLSLHSKGCYRLFALVKSFLLNRF